MLKTDDTLSSDKMSSEEIYSIVIPSKVNTPIFPTYFEKIPSI